MMQLTFQWPMLIMLACLFWRMHPKTLRQARSDPGMVLRRRNKVHLAVEVEAKAKIIKRPKKTMTLDELVEA